MNSLKIIIKSLILATLIAITYPKSTYSTPIKTANTYKETSKCSSLSDFNGLNADIEIYNKIYNSIKNHEQSISFNTNNPVEDYQTVDNIIYKLFWEHSELQDYTGTDYFYPYNVIPTLKTITIKFKYYHSKEEIDEFNRYIDKIISDIITADMTELQKELAIHDYIALSCSYDHSQPQAEEADSAYGCLIKHTAVCNGYAKAMNILLNKAGIDSVVMTSFDMHHAWNIVTINGKTYNVDVTWNDLDSGNTIRYNYFNQDDETFLYDHSWEESELHTPCTSTDFAYMYPVINYFRFDKDVYFQGTSCTTLYKSDLSSDFNKIQPKLISDEYPTNVTYYNGWIYFTKAIEPSSLYRLNEKNPSLIKTVTKNIYPYNIKIEDGVIYYQNYKTQKDESIKIQNYNKYDLNGDDIVDIDDLAEVALNYNKNTLSLFAHANEDFNNDDIIDIYDIVELSLSID